MQPVVEKLSGLERRVDLTVLVADVEKEVQAQLRRIARTAKVQGFRPGKAPLSIIERSHGPSVRYEVINTQIGKSFDKVIEEAELRLAGAPVLEPKVDDAEDGVMAFSATFEVYPEVQVPDLGALDVVRSTVEVGDAEVDKTIDILRRQRTVFKPAEGRIAQDGDRVTLDFAGTIDGVAFEGGTAEGFPFVLGQGRMLPEFEAAVQGMQAGEEKTFPLKFPDDYGSPDVAGKEAQFAIKVSEVAEPELPEIDADFARALGQAEGDVAALMIEIRGNVEREARARARNRTKASVMDALAAACSFDLPKALVDSELQERIKAMREELTQRGLPNADTVELPEDKLRPEAERRVRLGLLVGELIQQAELKARPEQVRARIEEFAQSYEQPAQVVAYYLSDKQRRAEIESFVLEDNVVDHVLGVAKVTDQAVDFDTLMGTR
ncbi:trigger factor [Castellaniella sp.]|uniref:trigger factor n=1 Tax=Castellaniella sp. TaxID=1955812 RepID=UPI00355E21EB